MHDKNQLSQKIHADICAVEKCVYFMIWLPSTIYPFFCLYKLSMLHQSQLIASEVVQKSWLSYMKDVSDNEWTFWWNYAGYFTLMFSCYTFGGMLLANKYPAHRQKYYVMASIFFLACIVSVNGVLLIICHVVLFYAAILTRRKILMWIWCMVNIFCIHNMAIRHLQLNILGIDLIYDDVLLYSILMCYLRNISFGCETIDGRSIKDASFEMFLCYVLYLPLFFNGPILTFDLFHSCCEKPKSVNLQEIIRDVITCLLYAVGLNIAYHFIYAHALTQHYFILEDITSTEAMAICWVHINYFCVKYYVFYRFPGIFVKLDGFVSPGAPKCVASLYTFVDMWRYFDKGLYRFLQRCIYFPVGGSKFGLKRKILASILCFSFVSFWHGSSESLWFWGISNCVGIILETCLLSLMQYLNVCHLLGSVMYRRLCCIGGAFSIFLLIYTNTVFLVGLEPANILLRKATSNIVGLILVLTVLYMSAHCSIEVSY